MKLLIICYLIIGANCKSAKENQEITKKLNLIPSNIGIKPKEYLASKYDKYDRSQTLLGILLENYSKWHFKLLKSKGKAKLKPEDLGPVSSKFAVFELKAYQSDLKGSVSWLINPDNQDESFTIDFVIPYRR